MSDGDTGPPNFDPRDVEAQDEAADQWPLLWICYLASAALIGEPSDE